MGSRTDFQLIIQDNLIKFVSAVLAIGSSYCDPPSQMGRRFPEFCILRAACRVSLKASSSATGDARVASYQAAIDSVAVRYYADWPFMVEVLNKWLEMNQDFVRDPLGHVASNSLPTPTSAVEKDHPAISTIQATPVLTSDRALAQIPCPSGDSSSLLLTREPDVPEHVTDSTPVASTSGTEPNDMGDPPSSPNGGRDVSVPIHKPLLPSWNIPFRFFPSLWNFVVNSFSSLFTLSLSRFNQNRGQH